MRYTAQLFSIASLCLCILPSSLAQWGSEWDHPYPKNWPQYVLADDYEPGNFFDKFNFIDVSIPEVDIQFRLKVFINKIATQDTDQSNGFVQYVDRATAEDLGLVQSGPNNVRIKALDQNIYTPGGPGRPSVRLSSKSIYTHALYIFDATHMPFGCGTWPAFWSYRTPWPSGGEIDIIEGANLNSNNTMTLHTNHTCIDSGVYETGNLVRNNCTYDPNDYHSDSGCSVVDPRPESYGAGFNAIGGGIYAMEWTSFFIRVWFFPRTSVPDCIRQGQPNPADFGNPIALYQTPAANFQSVNGSCDIDENFFEHNIIINIDFCGDVGANTYLASGCPRLDPDTELALAINLTGSTSPNLGTASCAAWVGSNPEYFSEAYWDINSLKVYTQAAAPVYTGPVPTQTEQPQAPFWWSGVPNYMGWSTQVPAGPVSVATQTSMSNPYSWNTEPNPWGTQPTSIAHG